MILSIFTPRLIVFSLFAEAANNVHHTINVHTPQAIIPAAGSTVVTQSPGSKFIGCRECIWDVFTTNTGTIYSIA